MHGHTGEVLFYSHLARNLGPDQPFYALQSRGLTGADAHVTIEEMAADYIQEIRSVQPRGPYCLAGYCFGGRIAFEMALQLREHGERIAFLGVFDTYFAEPEAQESVKSMHRFLESRAVNSEPLKKRLQAHFAQLSSLGFKERIVHIARHGKNAVAKVRDSVNQRYWRMAYRYYTKRGRPLPSKLQDVPEINLLAAVKYLPTRPAGCLTLLLNGPVPEDFSPNQDFGWRGLRAERFDVQPVPGKQDAMFQDPNAIVLAQKMAACLEEAAAQASVSAQAESCDPDSQEVSTAVLDSIPSGQFHQIH